MDPCSLTLRQLIWMAEGRDKHVWSVVSAMMALIANCHRDNKKRPLDADDFNPTLTKEERHRNAILITNDNVEIMRNEFKRVFS
jgi:hypothetical protein